jgi:hypothetical protein
MDPFIQEGSGYESEISVDNDPLLRSDDLEAINANTHEEIEALQKNIFGFKRSLYNTLINHDTDHSASDLGAMKTFHALFLQTIGYWIGMMDSYPVPKPQFSNPSLQKSFASLSQSIQMLARSSQDANTLVYSLLFSFSTQHPFDLGTRQKKEEDD